jgi:sialidase-1
LGDPAFEQQTVFDGGRFPNVVVATDGTVLATWGSREYRVRRSDDGGDAWGPEQVIAESDGDNAHGGGVVVDERSGAILVFVEEGNPADHPAPLAVYRSEDHGATWTRQDVTIEPDRQDHVPSMHMNEHGVTLRHGEHAGRLLRPARWYAGGNRPEEYPNHYTTALYSDDGGQTWHTSEPFPAYGTGEAAVAELSDGRIYYNSRRHWAPEGENPRMRWVAWSEDGGETWTDLSRSDVLPDGAQHRDYGLMAGLVRLPVAEQDILIFSNIESEEGRNGGTVWASFDGGETWPIKRGVEEGAFAYSSLAAGRPGTPSEGWIYLLFEGDGEGHVARFNLSWVLDGTETGDREVPAEFQE